MITAPVTRRGHRSDQPAILACADGWCDRAAVAVWTFPAVSPLPVALCEQHQREALRAYTDLVLHDPDTAARRIA